MAACASACSGRVLVRGREPRPGRTRTSDSSYSRGLKGLAAALRSSAFEHLGPHLWEFRQRFRRRANVFHLDAGNPQPDDGARGRHPVVGIGAPHAAVQWPRRDTQAVGCFLALPAETVDFGAQRREPVGLVASQVGDPAEVRHRAVGRPTPPSLRPQASARRRRAGRHRSRRRSGTLHLEVRTRLGAQRHPASAGVEDRRRRAGCWLAASR